MLYIYTEKLFFFGRIKYFFNKLFRRENRGPQAVLDSLTVGLEELGKDFTINKKFTKTINTACVISGVKTLEWAIKQKLEGRVKKIIAGPNLVVSPKDFDGILTDPLIDKIIVPSPWVKEYYIKVAPVLAGKIEIWPAGVSNVPEKGYVKNLDFVVYNKIGGSQLFLDICKILNSRGLAYKVLTYGKFKQRDYFEFLNQARFEIYLSRSESQGLAMFEAWARNVPAFVWENAVFGKDGQSVKGKISSPFLSNKLGMAFRDYEDFKAKLPLFLNTSFAPRKYIKENFTNKICAEKYLQIVNDSKNI